MLIIVRGGSNTDIAPTFLHDDAQDYAFLDADLSGFLDGVVDMLDVFAAVACLEHGWLVDVEEGVEVFPSVFTGKGAGGARVVVEAHSFYGRKYAEGLR